MCRQGTCKELSGDYDLTATPGRFLFHVASMSLSLCTISDTSFFSVHVACRTVAHVISLPILSTEWNADVDAYVVHTNYNEYAIVIMSKQKSSGDKSTSVKLYSEWPL